MKAEERIVCRLRSPFARNYTCLLRAVSLLVASMAFATASFCSPKVLTFSDRPYAETALPGDYGSDEEIWLTWSTQDHPSSLIASTGQSPFSDHSPDGANRFILAGGRTVIRFDPTVRLVGVFVRDNEPDFIERSASGLTVLGELGEAIVFSKTVSFVPTDNSGVWIGVQGGGAIDTLRLISQDDDPTKLYLIDDLEFEIYSETDVIVLAGLNQSVLEGSTVTLDGSGSLNAESFSWTQVMIGQEPEVTLSAPHQAVTMFTAPSVSTAAILTFELTASGPLGSDTARVEVTVTISKPPGTPPSSLTVVPKEMYEFLGACVEWTVHPDATRYTVYRAENDPQGDYVKVAPSISAFSYEDDWLEEGTVYFYRVAAVNEFGPGPASEPVGLVASRNLAFDLDASPKARILYPTGSGLKDIEIINNGLTEESYDSYHGGTTESADWYGYLWGQPRYFDNMVYHEGKSFPDGGWWTDLIVEYTADGETWRPVEELTISPPYNLTDAQEGRSDYTRFHMIFARCYGLGIRIYGEPGGVADFTSVAELEVYGDQAPDIVAADAGHDFRVEEGETATLHGEGSLNAVTYFWEQVRLGDEPEITLSGANTANPDFLVEDVASNTEFVFRVSVTGFHGPKSDTVTVMVVNKEPPGETGGLSAEGRDRRVELSWQANPDATAYIVTRSTAPEAPGGLIATGITTPHYIDLAPELRPYHPYYYRVVAVNDYGEGPASDAASAMPIDNLAMYPDAGPIARVKHPPGSGREELSLIRNGIVAEKGYDSFDGVNRAAEDWYGYLWEDPVYPDRVVYTMGKNFRDGGWWTFLTVQYTLDGFTWHEASNVTIAPPYDFEDYYAARQNYSSYTLTFDRVRALGLRIYGEPGGIVDFTSIVELEVYGLDAPVACKRHIAPPFLTPGGTTEVTLSVEIREPPPPDSLFVTEMVPEGALLVDAGGGDTSVPGEITWRLGPGGIDDTTVTYVLSVHEEPPAKLSFHGSISYGDISDQMIRGAPALYPKPSPPRNLCLEMGLVGHLRWSPVLEEGTIGYHVYRSVNGAAYEEVSGLVTEAFFDDPDVGSQASYRYKVTVENASGIESNLAESVAVGPSTVVMQRIESEDYNYGGGFFPGGEGLAGIEAASSEDVSPGKDYFFHQVTNGNSYRPQDVMDIQQFPDSGHYIGGAVEGDWWRYSFDVPVGGYVKMADLRAASSQEAIFTFFWDEVPVGQFVFHTGGEGNWRTYPMDIRPFPTTAGVHTLRIRVASGVSRIDSFGIGFGWPPSKREVIFADDFDRYTTTEEVATVGEWEIVNGSDEPEGAWRLWRTDGPPLAQEQPGPGFPGFSSGYMVSNGDFAGAVQLDEQLVSPEIDCGSHIRVTVQFHTAINIYQQDTEGDLQTTDFDISVYDEASQSWSQWVNLFSHDRAAGDDFSAIPKWLDVSSLADGRTVKFRWRFHNTHYDYWSAVDNVEVSGERRTPRVISAAVKPGGSVVISWESFGQGSYTVESSDDLLNGSWQAVPGTDWPIDETFWEGDHVLALERRFYRVRSE